MALWSRKPLLNNLNLTENSDFLQIEKTDKEMKPAKNPIVTLNNIS